MNNLAILDLTVNWISNNKTKRYKQDESLFWNERQSWDAMEKWAYPSF